MAGMLSAAKQRKVNSLQDEVEITGMHSVSFNLEKGIGKPHTIPVSNSFILCALKLLCRGATLSPHDEWRPNH